MWLRKGYEKVTKRLRKGYEKVTSRRRAVGGGGSLRGGTFGLNEPATCWSTLPPADKRGHGVERGNGKERKWSWGRRGDEDVQTIFVCMQLSYLYTLIIDTTFVLIHKCMHAHKYTQMQTDRRTYIHTYIHTCKHTGPHCSAESGQKRATRPETRPGAWARPSKDRGRLTKVCRKVRLSVQILNITEINAYQSTQRINPLQHLSKLV